MSQRSSSNILDQETGSYRWVILVTVWMTYLTVQILRLSIGPVAPFLKEVLGISNTQVGLLSTATGIIYLPSMAISGWIADRFGVKRVLVFGTFVGGLMVLLIFFFPFYNTIFLFMALSGIGFGCIFATAVKGLILWFPFKERATVLGINQAAVNVAGMIAASLFPLISITMGWRYSYLFTGIFVIFTGFACLWLYHDPESSGRFSLENSRAPQSGRQVIYRLLNNRNFWLLVTGTFFVFVVEFSVMANLVLYLKEDLRFEVVTAGTVLAVAQLSGAIMKPASGVISDRMLHGKRQPVYLAMCVIAAFVCIFPVAGLPEKSWVVFPIFILLGAATIGSGGIYTTLAGELAGKESAGTVVGMATAIANTGILVGPPLFGMIVDHTGSYRLAWLFMAISAFLASFLVFFIREPG